MARYKDNDSAQQSDIRVSATRQIWSFATGMLAICMIFGGPNKNTAKIIVPPIIITVGAVISTAFIWKSGKKSRQELPLNHLQQIEERLANLETIAGSGSLDLNNRIKQLETRDLQDISSNSHQS